MGFLPRFLNRQAPISSTRRAKRLVATASAVAAESYARLADKLPLVRELDPEQWIFVLTVGGVFVALRGLEETSFSPLEREKVRDVVTRRLRTWKPDGLHGMDDCERVYAKTLAHLRTLAEYQTDDRFLAPDAVGFWMAVNLLGHAPTTNDEGTLLRVVGRAVTEAFGNWWAAR